VDNVQRAVDDIRRKWVPDGRLGVFDVSLLPKMIDGTTTSRDARDALRRLAGESGLLEKVLLLPNDVAAPAAIVTAALAPPRASRASAPRERSAAWRTADVLERREEWLRRARARRVHRLDQRRLRGDRVLGLVGRLAERATARALSADIRHRMDGAGCRRCSVRVAARVVELADGRRGRRGRGACDASRSFASRPGTSL
jgi:hypothetical protein